MHIGSKFGGLIIITINRPNPHNHLPVPTNVRWALPHPACLSKGQPRLPSCDPASPLGPLHPSRTLDKSKLFMQNKPNPKTTKTNLTPYPKKHYAKTTTPQPPKNKPNSNPIQPQPHPALPNNQSSIINNQSTTPRPPKSTSCLPPAIKTPIPTTSGFRNFAFCFLTFDLSLQPLSPKSAQISVSAPKLSAKTSKNHHSFAQNKPNPKYPKTNPTPYPKKAYKHYRLPATQKNKPNSNPIKPNTNPILFMKACQVSSKTLSFFIFSFFCHNILLRR